LKTDSADLFQSSEESFIRAEGENFGMFQWGVSIAWLRFETCIYEIEV